MNYFYAFVGMVVFDVLYVWLTTATVAGKKIKAGVLAAALTGLNGLVVVEFVDNHWALAAACVGSFFGSVLGMYVEARLEDQAKGVTP